MRTTRAHSGSRAVDNIDSVDSKQFEARLTNGRSRDVLMMRLTGASMLKQSADVNAPVQAVLLCAMFMQASFIIIADLFTLCYL